MLLTFLIIIVGFLLQYRLSQNIFRQFSISQKQKIDFQIIMLLFFMLMTFIFLAQPATVWLFIGIILITLIVFPFFFRIYCKKLLKKQLIHVFDELILLLQSGKSFRSSFLECLQNQNGWIKIQLNEIYAFITTQQDIQSISDPFIRDISIQLIHIDRTKNRTVEQIRALRNQLKLIEDFKRKSAQVSLQIKAQAVVTTVMYILLMIYMGSQFGFKENIFVFTISTITFCIGLGSIFLIGRNLKWKV